MSVVLVVSVVSVVSVVLVMSVVAGSLCLTCVVWINSRTGARKNPHPMKRVSKKLPPTVKFGARKKDGSIQMGIIV